MPRRELSRVVWTSAVLAIALSVPPRAWAADPAGKIVVAQSSMGAPDPYSQTPPNPSPAPTPSPAPRIDPNPGRVIDAKPPQQTQPNPSSVLWGAVAFTADGSYSTIWKEPSQAQAEAKVAVKCAEYGRGACKTVSFSGTECVSLATFIGPYKRRRWALSFTAGGNTYPDAQRAALASCNSDERSQNRCQSRITACADGR